MYEMLLKNFNPVNYLYTYCLNMKTLKNRHKTYERMRHIPYAAYTTVYGNFSIFYLHFSLRFS